MLLDLNRAVACICPYCSAGFKESLSIFDFSGKTALAVICPNEDCGERCAVIAPKNKKYRIDVECPICTGSHSYYITETDMHNKKLIRLKCPESGMDIFFFGEDEKVDKSFRDALAEFKELAEECVGEDMYDETIYAILDRLEYLEGRGGVKCSCGSKKVKFSLEYDGIELRCEKCGKLKILTFDEQTLAALKGSEEIILR